MESKCIDLGKRPAPWICGCRAFSVVSLWFVRECLCRFYLQSLDGFWAGQPAIQEFIGKVARLVLEGEPFRQCPHGQREAVHNPVMAVTAQAFENDVIRLYDVGVAGLHRLLSHMDEIMSARVIIAIAGMEGALASVVGGLADCPVIAVPASVGYGAAFGGLAALLSMLNSCASGVRVVNIDNGFGAGYLASMINHLGGHQ